MERYCVEDLSTYFLYDIVYHKQHKRRNSNACLSVRSLRVNLLAFILLIRHDIRNTDK